MSVMLHASDSAVITNFFFSTGMDPVARRDQWMVISRMVNGCSDMPESAKTSVILTTHSMEECEGECKIQILLALLCRTQPHTNFLLRHL